MSSKSDLSWLEPRYGIRPHEIAFLVREYLKEQNCNQTVASFIQEHPQATRSQAPVRLFYQKHSLIDSLAPKQAHKLQTKADLFVLRFLPLKPNKKTLSLSYVVNKYCEMRNRGDKMEATLKELRKTKKQLLSTLFQLERDQQSQSKNTTSTIRITKPSSSAQIRTTHQETPNIQDSIISTFNEVSEPISQKPEEDTSNVQSIASAVVQNAAKLMEEHPNLAASLIEQLNDILSRRRRNETDSRDTRDAVYDQVMGSYAVERLIDNLIPHSAVETTLMSPLPEESITPYTTPQPSSHQPTHASPRRESHTSNPTAHHSRKKATRNSSATSSTLLTAGMRHPSIQVTSVRSPATPQLPGSTPQSSVPSTPMSPNQTPSRVGHKRRQQTSPETPGSSNKKRKEEI